MKRLYTDDYSELTETDRKIDFHLDVDEEMI